MKRIGLVVGLALVGFACADGVGEMLTDAGSMIVDAGNMIGDAGASMQDGSVPPTMAQEVSCSKSETGPWGDGTSTQRWAEFEVDPGQTEVTICRAGTASALGPSKRDTCLRWIANWIRGTSTGVAWCGVDYFDAEGTRVGSNPDPISITVHR